MSENFPLEALPYLIQSSPLPFFRGEVETETAFLCAAGCGAVLVENYTARQFIRVAMQCYQCGEISITPGLAEGEIAPTPLLSLGDAGKFRISKTLTVGRGNAITCDKAIERALSALGPRKMGLTALDLSEEGLTAIEASYDRVLGGGHAAQLASVKRHIAAGSDGSAEYPLPWSIHVLKGRLAADNVNLRDHECVAAVHWLLAYHNAADAWAHHPHFSTITRDLRKRKSYSHAITLFTSAYLLYQSGINVALALENDPGRPNPDMYILHGAFEKFYLEVKAPESLQWSRDVQFNKSISDASIKKAFKSASSQINRQRPGLLIIGSSLIGDGVSETLNISVENYLQRHGRDHRGISAAGILVPAEITFTRQEDRLDVQTLYRFGFVKNPYYSGPPGVEVGTGPGNLGHLPTLIAQG